MLINKKFFGLWLVFLPLAGMASQRAAMGPIDRVDGPGQAITVLGQTFKLNSATTFAIDGKRTSLIQALTVLSANQNVYVEGQDRGQITLATSISVSRAPYVPGATPVYVFGTVDEIAKNSGLIRLGSLRIDSSTMAPDLLAGLRVGLLIEVSGIQPLSGGTLVNAELVDVGGSGVQKQSVGGSGLQLQSVGGSGLRKESVGGSGIQVRSVGGSGVQKQSVGGSGLQLQSVGGSGLRKESVGGSGIQVRSVGGSGKQS